MQSFNSRLRAWLSTQCQLIGNVRAAMLVKVDDGNQQILAKWPDADTVGETLYAICLQAIHKQRLHLESLEQVGYRLAYPVLIDGTFWGVVALELQVADKKALTDVLREMKVGQLWLQFLVQQQTELVADHSSAVPSEAVVPAELLPFAASLLKEGSLPEMAISLVNGLAARLRAARVSLGLMERGKLRLEAVSHAAHVDARTHAMQAILEAMEEAVEQGQEIRYSPEMAETELQGTLISRAHQQLQQAQQWRWVASVPLRHEGRVVGALTIELNRYARLTEEQHQFLQGALFFVSGLIALRQDVDVGLVQMMTRRLGQRGARWFGPHHWRGRVASVLVIAVVAALFVPVSWRISGDASLQPVEKYLVVSPQDGYLGRVLVRPGDKVEQNAVLGALNDEDLLLERRKLASQVQRHRQAYDTALANLDRVEAAIANAQVDQASIQLRLIEQQLQRTQLLAPIEGIVVSDDISQKQGAPVKQGDILFELAAAQGLRVQMYVDERDIAALAAGQLGQVKFTSLPHQQFAVEVSQITPLSEIREGRNYFRVELRLGEETASLATDLLRPGMTGTAKVNAGKRALGWIWFHDIWHWLRLSLW